MVEKLIREPSHQVLKREFLTGPDKKEGYDMQGMSLSEYYSLARLKLKCAGEKQIKNPRSSQNKMIYFIHVLSCIYRLCITYFITTCMVLKSTFYYNIRGCAENILLQSYRIKYKYIKSLNIRNKGQTHLYLQQIWCWASSNYAKETWL